MKLIDALIDHNARVSYGDRWLVADKQGTNDATDPIKFTVYGREYGQKKTRQHIVTESEDEAVNVLLG